MAIFTPGPLVAEVRGKIGGQVFSRNKGGMYIKGFASPTNPNTALQSAVRSIFATLTNAWWDVLTLAQRAAWEDLAAANPIINQLGQSITLSGLNMYMRYNQLRVIAEVAREDDAPLAFVESAADPAFALADADSGGNTIEATFDDTLDWCDVDGDTMIVFMGKPVSPGRSKFHGPWRTQALIVGDALAPPTSDADLGTPAWNLVAGQRVWISAALIEAGKFPSSRFYSDFFTVS